MNSTKRGNKFILILLLLMVFGSRVIGMIVQSLNIPLSNSSMILIPQLLFITVPVILYFIITKEPVKETLMLNRLDGINVLLTIGVGIFIQPLLGLVNIISQLFFENKISGTVMSLLDFPLWLLLLLVAVLPAINEEIVTRGILLTNYKNVNMFKAALVSGLSFGMLHLNGNQFSYAFVMGIILFIFVKITGSIYSSMLIHFLINGLQMALAKLSVLLQKLMENYVDYEIVVQQSVSKETIASLIIPSLLFTLFTLPLVYLFFYLAVKYNKKQYLFSKPEAEKIDYTTDKKEKVFDAYLITSILIFVGFVIINEILVL